MKNFRQIYHSIGTFCLVLLMGITIVPKDFYHDCFSKEDNHQIENQHNESHYKSKCAICDFTFIHAYLSADTQVSIFHFSFSESIERFSIRGNTAESETLFLNKSPPALTFIS